jgi:hypothetical protein
MKGRHLTEILLDREATFGFEQISDPGTQLLFIGLWLLSQFEMVDYYTILVTKST